MIKIFIRVTLWGIGRQEEQLNLILVPRRENLLHQDFHAHRPWRKLLTDITQIQCADGRLYISPIMDCFNREILSLCMDGNMCSELCVNTLKTAAGYFPLRGAILHPDRGSQYTSALFR